MIRNLITLSVFLLLIACQNKESRVDKIDSEPIDLSVLPDMSIFHLPSKWTNQDGEDIELIDLQGKTLAITMIYTSCQASCPRLIADMRHIEKEIPKELEDKIQFVFVSIDPEIDTPERMRLFAKENKMEEDKWIFLRGSEENTREFAAVLAVSYKAISPVDFSHSNIISVFDKKGELVFQREGLGVNNQSVIDAIIKTTTNN